MLCDDVGGFAELLGGLVFPFRGYDLRAAAACCREA